LRVLNFPDSPGPECLLTAIIYWTHCGNIAAPNEETLIILTI
jgi:hypothetical protein